MKVLFLFFLLFSFQQDIFAQTNSNCPTFSVEHPPSYGEKMIFKVVFRDDFDLSNLKFNWIVSVGNLLSGQGTNSIVVKPRGTEASATIKLTGLPAECGNTASESVVWDPPFIILVDEYSKISSKDELEKLDMLTKELQNDPTTQAFIIKTFPRNLSRAKLSERLKQTLKLVKSLWIDESRFTFGINFKGEEKTLIFLVPAGAKSPSADETLSVEQLSERLKIINPKK